jgi:hypothetical protein
MKTYYKVFWDYEPNIRRVEVEYSQDKFNIASCEYKLGKWARPTYMQSRLFVFDSLEAVRDYQKRNGYVDFTVYECHCKGVIKNTNGYYRGRSCVGNEAQTFWNIVNMNLKKKKKWNYGLDKVFHMYDYIGVCFAKEVKLIKPIEI